MRWPSIPRITRRTLHEEVLERLRDMIIEGRLAPGQRINEGQVGAQLGVSRTPLREAIKTLASEGLVEILPAKGAIVRKFTAKDLTQILQVLKTLEQLGGRMACELASDATIEAIHTCTSGCSRSTNQQPARIFQAQPGDPQRHRRGLGQPGADGDARDAAGADQAAALHRQ
jgi:DNA-binding GntR family transcriptional regulator